MYKVCERRDVSKQSNRNKAMRRTLSSVAVVIALTLTASQARPSDPPPAYSLIFRGGTIYDGSGDAPFVGDVAIKDDRIAAVAAHVPELGMREIDIQGRAIAPGFINMLAHPETSLLVDGRAQSDLRQGVTLEVLGEDSMGPLSPEMKRLLAERQGDIKYRVNWTTLAQYLHRLEHQGVSVNVASFVGEGTVRQFVLGEKNVQPSPAQLARMRKLVRMAMEDGALGLTTALIYVPNTFARTPELIELAKEAGRCGGIYSAHVRNESDRLLPAIRESIEIATASGAPTEIYHFKQAGKDSWRKLDDAIALVEEARKRGIRVTADMYT